MRVLVTAASRYGATTELGQAIRDALAEDLVDATFDGVEHHPTLEGYEAVVLGSAVYAGHWLKAAREWVTANSDALAEMRVWLFSSGPVGDPLVPADDTLDVSDVVATTGAEDHEVFAGKLDRSRLKFADKAIAAALRVPDGDFRDFDHVRLWAAGIAEALSAPTPRDQGPG